MWLRRRCCTSPPLPDVLRRAIGTAALSFDEPHASVAALVVMRLLVSSCDPSVGWRGLEGGGCDRVVDVGEEFSGHVALEAADDFLFGASLGGAAGDVVLGGRV